MSDENFRMRVLGKKGIDSQSIHRASDQAMETPLSSRYYAKNNINLIMRAYIRSIKEQTGMTIGAGPQYGALIKVMRFIYTRLWHDDYQNIPQQIMELNRLTVKEAVKWTLPDLLMHKKFQSEVLRNPIPVLDHPKLMSQAGNKLNGQGISDALGL